MESRNRIYKWIMGAGFATAASIVMVNEGVNKKGELHHAYLDGAGVWTICYGETKGVKKGMVKTDDECKAQLRESIASHSSPLHNLPDSTPEVSILGSLDMAYNIGTSGFNNSTIKKHLMVGDYDKAGKAVLQWRYITRNGKKYDCSQFVNGKPNKVCYGLWTRRLIQSEMIGNKITTAEALKKLNAL